MEAIAAASSIVAVLQVTATVIRVTTEYIRDAKGANKSADDLRRELKSLRDILEQFMKSIDTTLKDCQATLLEIHNKLGISSGGSKVKSALLWPFREKEVEKRISALARLKSNLHLALSLGNTAIVKDIWRDVKGIAATQKGTNALHNIGLLETVDNDRNHTFARTKFQESTGKWFFDSQEFLGWRDNTSCPLVWLHGIPGCGKTILRISQGLQRQAALAYFYFDYSDPSKRNSTSFLSCVIAQLCRSLELVPGPVQALFPEHGATDQAWGRPNEETLWNALQAIEHHWSCIYIVVDALDECEEAYRPQMLSLIRTISSSGRNIRMLVTSRKLSDIHEVMKRAADETIAIPSGKVDGDISIYVDHMLSTDIKMRKWPSSDKRRVKTVLVQKAGGMFRWVFCQLETLRRCMNRTAVHRTLEALPKTLDHTYERIIMNIEEEYRYHAIVALHWLACTRRPLKLLELAEAVAVKGARDDDCSFDSGERLFKPSLILDICSSLVSASGANSLADVRLAHFTVHEYLLSDRIRTGAAAAFSVTLAKGNAMMASFCVSYLLGSGDMVEEEEEEEEEDEFNDHFDNLSLEESSYMPSVGFAETPSEPLLAYVTEYWYQHANSVVCHSSDLSGQIIQLLSNNPDGFGVTDWWKLAAKSHIGIWYEVPQLEVLGGTIGIAAYLGLFPEVEVLLKPEAATEEVNNNLAIALHAAAYGGHVDVANMLFEKGADPNAGGGLLGNSLQAAAYNGDLDLVKLLLQRGALPNAVGGKFGSAIQASAHRGHLQVCRLLLAAGADPNGGNGTGTVGSALQAAAYRVDKEMVLLLLENGSDPNASGGKYSNSLQAAAYRSAKDIIELLLKYGADPNTEGGEYGTALQAATFWGNMDIIQMLLDHGANPDSCGGAFQYGTAIQAAAIWGYLDIVALLLDRGADPNIDAGYYGTSLEAAIHRKDRPMCRVLLEAGATTDAMKGEHKALAGNAASQGIKETVDFLFKHSHIPDADLGCYGKAVQLAALKGYKDALRPQLGGSTTTLPQVHDLLPLHYATLKLHENLAEIIDEPEASDYSCPFTPLHWAAWYDHPEVIRHVFSSQHANPAQQAHISHGSEPGLAGDRFHLRDWSPLHVALFRRHISAARAICELAPHDNGGPAGLKKAAEIIMSGSVFFDSTVADANTHDGVLGWSSVHVAAMLHNTKLLEHWCIDSGPFSDIDVPDANGMTALHWVAATGHLDTVRSLLQLGADAYARDDYGRTPGDVATGEKRLAILDLLERKQWSFPNWDHEKTHAEQNEEESILSYGTATRATTSIYVNGAHFRMAGVRITVMNPSFGP
ncbi:hypothetical protein PG984_013103 [Apiospora sp. TS-2023a]